jgi:hypothetical protein
LHAPRQTGKTTEILGFVKRLNEEGKYKALYVNVEPAQVARSNYKDGLLMILDSFKSSAREQFGDDIFFRDFFKNGLRLEDISGNSLSNFLQYWSESSEKRIVLFIDEIDSLVGDTLISVLRQLRAGYTKRPKHFPQSVCLVGVRDVRDYRIWSDVEQVSVLGGSAFNIKAESLRFVDFTKEQVRDLYLQHTKETGQKFDDDAIEYAYHLTQGQPWLVNALAYEACFRDVKDRSKTITKEVIEKAKETLILRRDTHLDVLVDRLKEPRVRNIVDKIISGVGQPQDFPKDDISYVTDLGILAKRGKDLVVANPIYQEVIPRELSFGTQESLTQKTIWYQNEDGTINCNKLLESFQQFFRENSDIWVEKFDYKESAPHILLMAFLQRIINGGGRIHREYALGRRRVDLLIEWQKQRIVIELKIYRNEKTLQNGLKQTAGYMDLKNATDGHLIIFDRRKEKTWDEKVYKKEVTFDGKTISVWGM